MNLDEWLTQSTAELAQAEADLQAAERRVAELRTIQEGIRLAQARYGQEEQPALPTIRSGPAKGPSSGGRKSRRKSARRPQRGHSDLLRNLLTESPDRRISVTAAGEVLAGQGYDLDGDQVRNGFQYLVRTGQAVRVETGIYALAPSAE